MSSQANLTFAELVEGLYRDEDPPPRARGTTLSSAGIESASSRTCRPSIGLRSSVDWRRGLRSPEQTSGCSSCGRLRLDDPGSRRKRASHSTMKRFQFRSSDSEAPIVCSDKPRPAPRCFQADHSGVGWFLAPRVRTRRVLCAKARNLVRIVEWRALCDANRAERSPSTAKAPTSRFGRLWHRLRLSVGTVFSALNRELPVVFGRNTSMPNESAACAPSST